MKKMKKLLAVLTAGVMCAAMTAGAYVTAQEFPAVSDAAESTVMVQDDGETKVEGDFSYRVQEDGTIEILKYVGETTVTNLAVPGKIGDIPVTRLGSRALYGLTNLEGVSLPDSLTSIGQGAFWKTKLWATQESVVGSTKAIYAGHWAIGYYNGENVSIAEGTVGIADYAGTEEYIAFSGKISILSGGYLTNISLPNSLKYIGENAFYKQSNLKVIDVPDSVVKIGARAFLGTEIATINIPDGVTSIEDDTFYDCSSLSDIKLPSSITHIGKRAFAETKCVDDQETNEKYVGNWLVEGAENDVKLKEGTIGISDNAFNETSSHYNDPTYVTSIMMVSSLKYIGNEAFKDCNLLTEITFPKSVVSIGKDIFSGCTNLNTVKFNRNMEITQIPDGMFSGCTSLNKITLSDTTTRIGKRAFENCSSLANIAIPETVTQIDDAAFAGCRILTNFTMPESVAEVGGGVFYDCAGLVSIKLSDNLAALPYYSYIDSNSQANTKGFFEGCTSLKAIALPENLTQVDMYAFQNCMALENVGLPQGLTAIRDAAFNNCVGITDVYFGGSEEAWISSPITTL